MNRTISLLAAVCAALSLSLRASAAEWQWSVSIPSVISDETGDHPRAFLWIPSDCAQVRAVVVGQHNMCEENIFNNAVFRERMSEAGVALVWISPILNFPWDVTSGCNEALLGALDDLAEVSGYSELHVAPIVPLGHSAMATYPWNFAAWNPERTLAVISYHGDAPRTNLTGYGGANLEWGRTRNIDGIPGLMVEGEYEWWEARVTPALAFRMMYPGSCISFLCDAGRGHFDISDLTVDYIGLFIRKALETRLPDSVDWTRPVALKKLNPRDGYLAERWRTGTAEPQGEVRTARLKKQPKRSRPAPYSEYEGDSHDAFWYFDREMAELTEEIYRQDRDMLPQYLSFEQDGELVPYNASSHVTLSFPFRPEADGVTFRLKPVYTDSLRTSLTGQHSEAAPRICDIYGPVRQIDDTTFTLSFYRMGTSNLKRRASITLIASADGDSRYKETVQEIGMRFPYPLTEGKSQHISFPAISDIGADEGKVELRATSDSGLPVYYYVKEGPAEVVGNELVLTKIPPRGKMPVKVTAVAWQYGIAGEVQTAEPVERSFNVYPSRRSVPKTAAASEVKPFPLSSVRLLPSRFRDNLQRDSVWMMSISTDQLLHSFRTSSGVYAGLEGGYDSLRKLGGWESLDCELRGHTTGHLLSAYALMYAATGEECFKAKGDSLVAGLSEVQKSYGNGYLSAFPEGLIDRNIRGERVWAPWYTLHKIAAGLLDQYNLAGSQLALEELKGMAGWAYAKLSPLSEQTRTVMLRNEFGGIGEAWWNLYSITGDSRHRFLAEFFVQDEVIGPLREGKADFGTKHTNTYIPKVIAEARNYELNGDPAARGAVEFFWSEMLAHHIFATGSLSDKEHFFLPEEVCRHISGVTGETCCTYNMLRLARHIFCWNPSSDVADYYERALCNHILGGQNPADGMVSYFLPLKSGTHKVYSTPYDSFWCCVGSSFESNAKYGESIWFHDDNTLYLNLFIPSVLSDGKFGVRLESDFPESGRVKLTLTSAGSWTLALRQPYWSGKPSVKVNGSKAKVKQLDGGYLGIQRKWKEGDTVEIVYTMDYHIEPASGDPSVGVVMRGPLVLARPLGTEGFVDPQPVSDPGKHNDYYTYDYHIPAGITDFAPLPTDYSDLVPLYSIHGERYEVYWKLSE